MPRIELAHLTKRYGAVTAVDDLSFSLQPGSITGFVGANGAGKSTTLRMLLGLTRPPPAQPPSMAGRTWTCPTPCTP